MTKNFIFSKYGDVIAFVLPMIISVKFLFYPSYHDATQDLLYLYLFQVLLGKGHCLFTAVPISEGNRISSIKALWGGLAFLGLFVAAAFISFDAFKFMLGNYTIWHFASQQVAWLKILHRKDPTVSQRRLQFERYLTLAVMIYPLLFWTAGAINVERSYFYYDNLLHLGFLPAFLFTGKWIGVAVLAMASVLVAFRKNEGGVHVDGARMMFFVNTFASFVGALLIFENLNFLLGMLIATHCVSYSVFIYHGVNYSTDQKVVFKRRLKWMFVLGTVWAGAWYYLAKYVAIHMSEIWSLLYWAPLVYHYGLDSFIWTKNFLGLKKAGRRDGTTEVAA